MSHPSEAEIEANYVALNATHNWQIRLNGSAHTIDTDAIRDWPEECE